MTARAISKNIRFSAQKLRLYADSIRGKNLLKAYGWLQANAIKRTIPIAKTLLSAYHNAKQADETISQMGQLVLAEIRIDQGPTVRYIKPTAMGRAAPQRRRTSHISVVVKKIQPAAE